MSDKEKPQGKDPNYVAPPFLPLTEREAQAVGVGFSRGYREGTHDIVCAIASGHHWALKKVEEEKNKLLAEVTQPAR